MVTKRLLCCASPSVESGIDILDGFMDIVA